MNLQLCLVSTVLFVQKHTQTLLNHAFNVSGDSGIWGLKKNFALLELLEKLQFSPQTTQRPSSFTDESLAKQKEVCTSVFTY